MVGMLACSVIWRPHPEQIAREWRAHDTQSQLLLRYSGNHPARSVEEGLRLRLLFPCPYLRQSKSIHPKIQFRIGLDVNLLCYTQTKLIVVRASAVFPMIEIPQ